MHYSKLFLLFQINREAQRRLRSFLENEQASSSSQASFPMPTAPPRHQYYTTKVSVFQKGNKLILKL